MIGSQQKPLPILYLVDNKRVIMYQPKTSTDSLEASNIVEICDNLFPTMFRDSGNLFAIFPDHVVSSARRQRAWLAELGDDFKEEVVWYRDHFMLLEGGMIGLEWQLGGVSVNYPREDLPDGFWFKAGAAGLSVAVLAALVWAIF